MQRSVIQIVGCIEGAGTRAAPARAIGGTPLAVRCHRRHSAVWRIHDQLGLTLRPAALAPMVQACSSPPPVRAAANSSPSAEACCDACFWRCANSSSFKYARVPNSGARCNGTPIISELGQIPCRSGSPHAVRGATHFAGGRAGSARRLRGDNVVVAMHTANARPIGATI